MRRTSRLLVVFGIGLAVLTFLLIVFLLPGSGGSIAQPTPTPVVNVQVVVATQDIPLGTVVTADMLSTSTLPVGQATPGYLPDPSIAVGRVARQAIVSGAQVSTADFSTDQPTIKVPTGRRALAVSVNELTGVGNLIFPGDWVDVVITLDKTAIPVVAVQPPNKSPFAHDDGLVPVTVKASALLQDIQVLGTLEAPQPGPAASPGASQGPSFNGVTTQKLVILAVTDDQAEAILFARYFDQTGTADATGASATINLILRSADDSSAPPVNTSGVDLKTMFDKYGVVPPYIERAIDAYIALQQP